MQAIFRESFTIESLRAIQTQHRPVDLGMLERTAHALELLGRLVDAEVDLIFKGGTSLILRLQKIRRLAAIAMMTAGWDGAPDKAAPGFPDNGQWSVRWEGLNRMP